jgi:uncharacterized membrane protein YoaT (DUF817 family)
MFHKSKRSAFEKLFGFLAGLTAGVSGVPDVRFLVQLVTCQADLLCVDDNNVITTVHMRGKIGFVFAAQQGSCFYGKSAQHLIGSVNYYPFFGNGSFVGAYGLVG